MTWVAKDYGPDVVILDEQGSSTSIVATINWGHRQHCSRYSAQNVARLMAASPDLFTACCELQALARMKTSVSSVDILSIVSDAIDRVQGSLSRLNHLLPTKEASL